MQVFLERYVLAILAALTVLMIGTNPMGFDLTQRITAGLTLIFAAYFFGHTIHKNKDLKQAQTADLSTGKTALSKETKIDARSLPAAPNQINKTVSGRDTYNVQGNLVLGDKSSDLKAPESEDRPILEPTLIIDSVEAATVYYHFSVKNTGAIAATAIRFAEKSTYIASLQVAPPVYSQLMPGARMSYRMPGILKLSEGDFNDTLTIKYSGNKGAKEYQSSFFFSVPDNAIRPGEYLYAGANHDGTPTTTGPQEEMPKRFLQPEGSIFIVLPEKNANGSPNLYELNNGQRQFSFNPRDQLVYFKTKTISGREASLRLPLTNSENGDHLIAFGWNAKGGALVVDGHQVEDFRGQE